MCHTGTTHHYTMRAHAPVVLHESLVVFEHESNDKEEMLYNGEFVTGHGRELSEELP